MYVNALMALVCTSSSLSLYDVTPYIFSLCFSISYDNVNATNIKFMYNILIQLIKLYYTVNADLHMCPIPYEDQR